MWTCFDWKFVEVPKKLANDMKDWWSYQEMYRAPDFESWFVSLYLKLQLPVDQLASWPFVKSSQNQSQAARNGNSKFI